MRSIKIRDLEMVERDNNREVANSSNTIESIAMLTVSNEQKDKQIQDLSKTIAQLTVDISKLKGGNK